MEPKKAQASKRDLDRTSFLLGKMNVLCVLATECIDIAMQGIWPHKNASWGPECIPLGDLEHFLDAQEGRMGGFRAPRECRVAIAPPVDLRFREGNECFVCFRVQLATQSGLM